MTLMPALLQRAPAMVLVDGGKDLGSTSCQHWLSGKR